MLIKQPNTCPHASVNTKLQIGIRTHTSENLYRILNIAVPYVPSITYM